MTDYAIESRGLTRHFGSLVAVDHLELRVPRACVFGFLGPNGSGKSTTIRMLCGLLTPTSGEAEVLGVRVPRQVEQLRRKIGYMTQKFSLYGDLSIQENLEFMAQIYALPRRQARSRVAELLERFDLADRRGQLAGTLSGGQKQRLALAAATLHDPELMFLDEPTSAVDPESRRQFWEYLFDMVDEGKTILVSTHFMDEAERCHRLAILDEGRLVAEGVPDDLMRDIAASVVEIQSGHTREVRSAILDSGVVLHVAQLGNKLHALVRPEVADPVESVRRVIEGARGASGLELRRVDASLEDVFVVATTEA